MTFDWRGARMGHPNALDFVFDTNGVRALGMLAASSSTDLVRRVARLQLRSGWVPWVLAELLVTNLRRKALSLAELREIQRAAALYDELVGRNILLSPDERFVRDLYLLAQEPEPPRPLVGPNDYRQTLDFFLGIDGPEQIAFDDQDENAIVANYLDQAGEPIHWLSAPTTFVGAAKANVEYLQEPPVSKKLKHVDRSAASRAWRSFFHTVARLDVPQNIVEKAIELHGEAGVGLASSLSASFEGIYLAQAVAGVRGRVEENDGRDIVIAGYLSEATLLVTDDRRFRSLVSRILAGRAVTFDQFRQKLGSRRPGNR